MLNESKMSIVLHIAIIQKSHDRFMESRPVSTLALNEFSFFLVLFLFFLYSQRL